jgi:steroid delta-isomerase-like uncharacterized protein
MSASEEAKEIIRRWNEEGWSGGRYDLAHEIISPDMQVHGAGGQAVGMGPDGLIDLIKTWRTAFPDGRMEIDALIVEGDTVAIRNTWYGTQTEEFYGVPASGKSVAVTSVGIDRVQDGLVTEGWGELDMVGMMQQMGALPMVGPGAVANGGDPTWGPTASGHTEDFGLPRENRGILRHFIHVLETADPDAAQNVADVGRFVDHSPSWGTTDIDSVMAMQRTLRLAMPDLHYEVDEDNMVCEGSHVAAHSVVRGTHTGAPLFGVEPSGKEIVWTHSDFVTLASGFVVERWSATDTLTLFQQVGVLPSMGG